MAEFQITARDADGKQVTDTITASDKNAAVAQVTARGLFPVKVSGGEADESVHSAPNLLSSGESRRSAVKKPRLQDLANYTRQLANLLKAGMPLTSALQSMTSMES